MQIKELKYRDTAPSKGQVLAYTRKKVVFKEYGSLDEIEQLLEGLDILELHLFNADKEYRAIATESSRYPLGIIEYISNFDNNKEHVYEETCELDEYDGTLTVLNHINYDENGMLQIDDYRLVMGGRNND